MSVSKVYVGGVIGSFPSVVSSDISTAMIQTARMVVVGADLDKVLAVVWTAKLINGEPSQLRFTADVDGTQIYVELFDVESANGSGYE